MKKRLALMLMALVMMFTMLPIMSYADVSTPVPSVNINYNVDNFNLFTNTLEGDVNNNIKQRSTVTTEGVRLNTANTGLMFKLAVNTYSGIGNGTNKVDETRNYYMCIHLQLEDGYDWPPEIGRIATTKTYIPVAELSSFQVFLNGRRYSGEGYVRLYTDNDIDISVPIVNDIVSINLSANSFTYNGKTQMPEVTSARLSNGDLVNSRMYTISCLDGNEQAVTPINPGTYYVLLSGTGIYGTGRKAFVINDNPRSISTKPVIAKPVSSGNKIDVKWKHLNRKLKKNKKIWKKIKKVQVQCAADKDFTKIIKTVKVSKNRTHVVIKGLKKKTKYYVRVRYYDGKGYSAWSKVKMVKTRK